jgi:uncharacterized protein (TIGR02757 family)
MIEPDIKDFLEEKVEEYNQSLFIPTDPIQVPHTFSRKEDIEISAFLTATIAWGQRVMIIKNANRLMKMMGNDPYHFIINYEEVDLEPFLSFVHRTFNGFDCICFLKALREIYLVHGGLEEVFNRGFKQSGTVYGTLKKFREIFFGFMEPGRCGKHVSDVTSNSAAKRLNMFLRWMVRKDSSLVDFGLWTGIPASALMIPLDLHTGKVSRELGLLKRKQDDWKAVVELTEVLRTFDADDPIKYDYALFGLSAFNKGM